MKIDIKKTADQKYEVVFPYAGAKKSKVEGAIEHEPVAGSVNIQSVDPKYVTDIAFLVDRDDFLHDIVLLRKKWKIGYHVEFSIMNTSTLHNWAKSHLNEIYPNQSIVQMFNELLQDVSKIRHKYGRSSSYDDSIMWVLFTHSVPEGIFKPSYFTVLPESEIGNLAGQFALIIDGRAEERDVLNAYQEFRDYIDEFADVKNSKPSPHATAFQSLARQIAIDSYKGTLSATSDSTKVESKPTILLIRELYWKKKTERITYEELANHSNKKCDKHKVKKKGGCFYCNATYASVKQAVISYRKQLKK